MAKAKALTPKRAPGSPGAEPALVKKVVRKKNKRFGGRKRRNVSQKPENDPRLVVVRPPKAPEDFSPNWKALQEVRPGGTPRTSRLSRRPSLQVEQRTRGPQQGAVRADSSTNSKLNRSQDTCPLEAGGELLGRQIGLLVTSVPSY